MKQLTADARIRKLGGDLHTALKRKIIILLKELRLGSWLYLLSIRHSFVDTFPIAYYYGYYCDRNYNHYKVYDGLVVMV